MPTKDQLAARAKKVSNSRNQEKAQTQTSAPRTKPIKMTVEAAPTTYRILKSFCVETAEELNQATISNAAVIRILIEELQNDTDLRNHVKTRLRNNVYT